MIRVESEYTLHVTYRVDCDKIDKLVTYIIFRIKRPIKYIILYLDTTKKPLANNILLYLNIIKVMAADFKF